MINKSELIPPADLVAQCELLNKELGMHKEEIVILYLQDTEFEPEWRFKIYDDQYKRTVVEHLIPANADWHTYYLLLDGARKAFEDGIKNGVMSTIEQRVNEMCMAARIKPKAFQTFFAENCE
jgi:hypothetical protein